MPNTLYLTPLILAITPHMKSCKGYPCFADAENEPGEVVSPPQGDAAGKAHVALVCFLSLGAPTALWSFQGLCGATGRPGVRGGHSV